MGHDSHEFEDLSGLSGLLRGILWLYVLLAVVGVWSGWLELSILQRAARGFYSEAEAAASDSRQALVAGLCTITFVVTAILFLRWTYVANRNIRSLGAEFAEFTPGWAVGWYFVPIATFWKPYQALKETFQASHPDFTSDWPRAPRPPLMPVWWTLWIVACLLGNAVLRGSFSAESMDGLILYSRLSLLSCVLDIPLGLILITLVATLTDWQRDKHARVQV